LAEIIESGLAGNDISIEFGELYAYGRGD